MNSHKMIIGRVHAAKAERMYAAGQALLPEEHKPRQRVTFLRLIDHHPTKNPAGYPTNSLKCGYMQTLAGGESLRIETARESRAVTTEPCRAFKLKRIHSSLEPIYRRVLIEVTA